MTLTPLSPPETFPLVLKLSPAIEISDDQFFEFCQMNSDIRMEKTATGEVIIMPPTGGETGRKSFNLAVTLGVWAKADGTGIGFDSSTGFTLPNGAIRSPDVAWVRRERWEALSPESRQKFPPICPDFVIELRSKTDSLKTLQEKLREYIENGTRLGFLIDADNRRVYVYRPAAGVECLENPEKVSGEPVLPRFVLDMERVFEP